MVGLGYWEVLILLAIVGSIASVIIIVVRLLRGERGQ